jgi:hypothetical protein
METMRFIPERQDRDKPRTIISLEFDEEAEQVTILGALETNPNTPWCIAVISEHGLTRCTDIGDGLGFRVDDQLRIRLTEEDL